MAAMADRGHAVWLMTEAADAAAGHQPGTASDPGLRGSSSRSPLRSPDEDVRRFARGFWLGVALASVFWGLAALAAWHLLF